MRGKYILLFALLIFTASLKTGCDLKTSEKLQAAGSQTKGQVPFKDEGGESGTTEDDNEF
jgi:hypothetical protein